MGGAIRREDKDVLNPEAASFKVAEKCETLSSLKEEQKQIFSQVVSSEVSFASNARRPNTNKQHSNKRTKGNLAAGLINKLFELIFYSNNGVGGDQILSLSERFSALKKVLEPTHSKFGFALADETTSSSSFEEINEQALMSTDTFTRRMRKQLEKLMVFYDSEIYSQ